MSAEIEDLRNRVAEIEKALKGGDGTGLIELAKKLQMLADLVYRCAQKIDPGLAQEVKRQFP